MKQIVRLCAVIALLFASCAGSTPVPRQGETIPAHEPEKPDPGELERIMRLVKTNSGEIRKRVVQDEDRTIRVKGEPLPGNYTGDYEITYDLMNASAPEAERLIIAFSLEDRKSGVKWRDSFTWFIPDDNAGILLSFDDNYEAVWETWLDTFDEYGARVNFFVHGKSPFSETALSRGHDVGYHTRNHLNLLKVTREVFFEESAGELDKFRRCGIPLRAFAYPFGLWEPWMHEELLRHFSALRGYGVSYRLYGHGEIAGTFSSSTALDNTLYGDDGEFTKTLTLMLRTVKFLGAVFPAATHTISDSAAWGIKEERLIYLLETARSLKLRFYRYSDFSG